MTLWNFWINCKRKIHVNNAKRKEKAITGKSLTQCSNFDATMTGYLCVHNVECWRCWQYTKKPDKLLGDKLTEQNCVFAECEDLLYIFISTGMQNFTPHWCKDSFVKWWSVRSTQKQNIQRELILWDCYSYTIHNTFIWASEMPDEKIPLDVCFWCHMIKCFRWCRVSLLTPIMQWQLSSAKKQYNKPEFCLKNDFCIKSISCVDSFTSLNTERHYTISLNWTERGQYRLFILL